MGKRHGSVLTLVLLLATIQAGSAQADPVVTISSPDDHSVISDIQPWLVYDVQSQGATVTEVRLYLPCRGFWDWCFLHLKDSQDSWLPSGSTFDLAPGDSAYRVSVKASDALGTVTVESFFTLDGLAPRVTITGPDHGQIFPASQPVQLGYSISDYHSGEHWANGSYVPSDVSGLSDVTIRLNGVLQPSPAFSVGATDLTVPPAELTLPPTTVDHAVYTAEIAATDGPLWDPAERHVGRGFRTFLRRRGTLDFDLGLTGEAPRVGHPLTLVFDRTYRSLALELDGVTVAQGSFSDRLSYTPLLTGDQSLVLTVEDGAAPVVETIDLHVVDQHLIYVPRFEASSRPMISLWKSKPYETGLGMEDYAGFHLARAVWIHDRFFPADPDYQRVLSPQTLQTDIDSDHAYGATHVFNSEIVDQLYENHQNGQDIVLMPLKFPHLWQFNETDYSDDAEGECELHWESPFAADGPAEVGGWFTTIFQQIKAGLHERICPIGTECPEARIDHVVLDWEQAINRNNNPGIYPNDQRWVTVDSITYDVALVGEVYEFYENGMLQDSGTLGQDVTLGGMTYTITDIGGSIYLVGASEQALIEDHTVTGYDDLSCLYQIFNIWSTEGTCCADYEEATRLDPRFAAAGGDPDDGEVWDMGLPPWTPENDGEARMFVLKTVLETERERMLRDAFFQPFIQIFPDGLFSQWLYFHTGYPEDTVTTGVGFPEFGSVGFDAANTASPVHYFRQAHPSQPCVYSDDEIRRWPINLLRTVARNEPAGRPIIPWITDPSAPRNRTINHNPGVPYFDDQEQWEAFVHLLFSGAGSFNFWNHPDPRLSHVIQNAWGTFLNVVPDGSVTVTTENLPEISTAEPSSLAWISAVQDPAGTVRAMVSFLCETDPASIPGCDDCLVTTECDCPDDDYLDSTTFLGRTLERPAGRTFGIYVIDAPQGGIAIDSGAAVTHDFDVVLDLTADGDVVEMRPWNEDETPGVFVPFQSSLPWTLSAGPDGERTVRVQYRRADGTQSVSVADDILLDADTDDDGLPDSWELEHFGDLDQDGGGDPDGDGLSDRDELAGGSDPLDPDSDDDGVSDGADNCLLLYNPSQGDLDFDLEGDVCDLDDGVIYVFFAAKDLSEWQEESGFDAWNAYRGDLATLVASGIYTQLPGSNPAAAQSCGLSSPSVPDVFEPAVGGVAFYLTSGVGDGVESNLGQDSAGNFRVNANPCP